MNYIGIKILESERLILRKISINDAEDMFNNWATDVEVTKYLTWNVHENLNATKELIGIWVEEFKNDDCFKWCIELKETNEVIGTIGVVTMDKNIESVEIGYCLSRKYWSKGIMSDALKFVIRYLFDEVEVNRIEAVHDIRNTASGKVMEKNGMQYEGIKRHGSKDNKGDFCDIAVYGILKSDNQNRLQINSK